MDFARRASAVISYASTFVFSTLPFFRPALGNILTLRVTRNLIGISIWPSTIARYHDNGKPQSRDV